MSQSIFSKLKEAFSKKCSVPDKSQCVFAHKFQKIDDELEKIIDQLDGLTLEVGKLVKR